MATWRQSYLLWKAVPSGPSWPPACLCAPLRHSCSLGLATTVLTGGALLLAGELSFLYFLGFLFAAARLYDPLGVVLQNIAAPSTPS